MLRIIYLSFVLLYGYISNAQIAQMKLSHNASSPIHYAVTENSYNWFRFKDGENITRDFRFLEPSYIVKTRLKQKKHEEGEALYHYVRPDGGLDVYRPTNEGLLLVTTEYSAEYLKEKKATFNVIGKHLSHPSQMSTGQTYKNDYQLSAFFSYEDFVVPSFIPDIADSVQIIIDKKEESIVDQISPIRLHHYAGIGAVVEHKISTELKIRIKYNFDRQKWYDFYYQREELPFQLKRLVLDANSYAYSIYSKDYTLPLVAFDLSSNNINNVIYQDPYNVFAVDEFDANFKTSKAIQLDNKGNYGIKLSGYPFSDYRVEVYDVATKRIHFKTFVMRPDNYLKIDLHHLNPGIYFYRLVDSKGIKSPFYKIIKGLRLDEY